MGKDFEIRESLGSAVSFFQDADAAGAVTRTPDLALGCYYMVAQTAAAACTIAAPVFGSSPVAGKIPAGTRLFLALKLTAAGSFVLNAAFKGTPTAVTNGNTVISEWVWDGAAWRLVSPGALSAN